MACFVSKKLHTKSSILKNKNIYYAGLLTHFKAVTTCADCRHSTGRGVGCF